MRSLFKSWQKISVWVIWFIELFNFFVSFYLSAIWCWRYIQLSKYIQNARSFMINMKFFMSMRLTQEHARNTTPERKKLTERVFQNEMNRWRLLSVNKILTGVMHEQISDWSWVWAKFWLQTDINEILAGVKYKQNSG